uniref:DUF1618 domain-containing protein n=1 Tax=Oryza punctata TaxID=4537 RepID=A0A0E0L063_ORYPU
MQRLRLPLRRALSAVASRRALSTTASRRPPWAMVEKFVAVGPPERRVSLRLAEPPCGSRLFAPAHLVGYAPRVPDPDTDELNAFFGGFVDAASGDGLLLLSFMEVTGTAPLVPGSQRRVLTGISIDPDMTRFVCNPISGELFGLPDIDGTKKTAWFLDIGILTQSERPHGPPDRYAVAVFREDSEGYCGGDERFALRRFLSQTGKWDKLVGLPSSLPLHRRRMDTSTQQVVAFAGRLWWVDLSWGALSADPFSDHPEFRFVELPRGSVTQPMEKERRDLRRYRCMGVSEGRLRYAEVSKEEPFVLSSFTLDDDGGGGWTLEHRVALRRLWPHDQNLCKNTPQIAAIDPLNAGCMHLIIGKQVLSIDMDNGDLLGCTLGGGGDPSVDTLTPCLLPPWLSSCRIPCAETLSRNKADAKGKTLSDMLAGCTVEQVHGRTARGLSELHSLFGFSLAGKAPSFRNQQHANASVQNAAAPAPARPLCRRVRGRPAHPLHRGRLALALEHAAVGDDLPILAVRSTAPRAFFMLAEPPGASNLYVPDHLFDRRPGPDPDNGDIMGVMVCTTSGDGLLLLVY